MRFSIITPVYLGDYKQAGKGREAKFIRCINSVLNQNYGKDYEHIIISDGCDKAVEIVSQYDYELQQGKIRLFKIPKQKAFSGVVRNTGIEKAQGECICYLDSDDILGVDHLLCLDDHLNGHDWVFFNDLIWDGKQFEERTCTIKQYDCGTSNIAHRRDITSRWPVRSGYGKDDWQFIADLRIESKKWAKIPTPEYIVCHIPRKFDV